ncbi:hypothetical protein HW555_009077 [Spodoptera exigua]|uniref:Uncharacterized protein n=1 Tax=Spodoptera exigua TaxID=7107 RepID=A0A835L140_SPOEX|nr:hypothetical protein HW555_009077 [Spodoptera exigua]
MGMHQVLHGFPNPVVDREGFNTWLITVSDFVNKYHQTAFAANSEPTINIISTVDSSFNH